MKFMSLVGKTATLILVLLMPVSAYAQSETLQPKFYYPNAERLGDNEMRILDDIEAL